MNLNRHKETLTGLLFIAPSFIGFMIFTIIPVIAALFLGFTKWSVAKGISSAQFVGIDNFARMISDEWFTSSFINQIIYSIFSVPVTMAFALIFAVLLNTDLNFKKTVRTMFFLPYISNVVVIAAVWMIIMGNGGPVYGFLKFIGIEEIPYFFMDSKWVMPMIITIGIWVNLGYNVVVYLAGIQDIPRELYEAATVDGTNIFQKFYYITVPMLTPSTFFLLVTGIIGSFTNVFGLVNIITQGGPGNASSVLVYYIYRVSYIFRDMGYGSAIAGIMFVTVLAITLIQWQGQKKWVNYF